MYRKNLIIRIQSRYIFSFGVRCV